MNYGKNRPQKSETPHLPFLHDGQASTRFLYQSPFHWSDCAVRGGFHSCIGSIQGILANTPDVNEVDIMPLGYATFLYDCNGNQMRKLAAPNANRLPVSIEQIPEDLQHAVVAIEDERFYEHNGIDVRGILRAAVKALTIRLFRGCKYHYPAASEK